MNIVEEIKNYIEGDKRDTGRERLLLKELKKLSQGERYKALKPYLNKSRLALLFAQKSSLEPKAYYDIWSDGLVHSNASSIQWWVVTVASNLGWKKTLSLFEKQIEAGNEKIGEAIYHVPFIFGDLAPNPKAKEQFVQLVLTAENMGLLGYSPDSIWGAGWRA